MKKKEKASFYLCRKAKKQTMPTLLIELIEQKRFELLLLRKIKKHFKK
jgi:hypothetical protein